MRRRSSFCWRRNHCWRQSNAWLSALVPICTGCPLPLCGSRARPLPSLAILRELSTRREAGDGLVVVHSAIPPAKQSQFLHLAQLKFSEHEANLVADNYHVLATMQGPVATFPNLRTVLTTHAGRVGIVHLSAHAVENVNLPSRSLLMLSDGPVDMASMA
ncbi:MAG: CHAT domain-containing protein, partial [Planctomycetota bacterium]